MTELTADQGLEPAPPPRSPRTHRRWLWIAVAGVAAVAVLYLGAWLFVGGSVPRGTTVLGVDIGGMTPPRAQQVLNEELGPRSGDPLTVSVEGKTSQLDPAEAGLDFDAAATVTTAGQRSFNPWTLIHQVSGQEVAPVSTVDQVAMAAALDHLSRRVDKKAREGGLRIVDGEPQPVVPAVGHELDRPVAIRLLQAAYLTETGAVTLPVVTVEPTITAAQVQTMIDSYAKPALSAPLTVALRGQSFELSVDDIARSLRFVDRHGTLVPTVDVATVREALGPDFAAIGTPAVDASFDVSSGRPKIVPGKPGRGVSDEELQKDLVAALPNTDDRVLELTFTDVPPSFTVKEAKALGIKRVVSSYTQWFPPAEYRYINIGQAAENINGTLLKPGDTFSMNGVVGERTPENGFVKGYVIVGDRLVEDYGGAVSTITTAMWHTAFYAGMTRIEQRAHGFWITRYTPGLEATVAWGSLDLKFRNDTPYGILITAHRTEGDVTVTFWSTRYWNISAESGPHENVTGFRTVYSQTPGCVPQDGIDGFDITVTRVWRRVGSDAVVRREPMTTHYEPAPTVICGPKPKPSPSGTKKPSPSGHPKPTGSPSPSPTKH
jgi:vancomycin resistance protein YoaR